MFASSPASAANLKVITEYEFVTTTNFAGDTDHDANYVLPFSRHQLLPIPNLRYAEILGALRKTWKGTVKILALSLISLTF
jgi:hypothetical protein